MRQISALQGVNKRVKGGVKEGVEGGSQIDPSTTRDDAWVPTRESKAERRAARHASSGRSHPGTTVNHSSKDSGSGSSRSQWAREIPSCRAPGYTVDMAGQQLAFGGEFNTVRVLDFSRDVHKDAEAANLRSQRRQQKRDARASAKHNITSCA